MKYNQFLQLHEILENKGITLDQYLLEYKKNYTEDDTLSLETEKGNIFTRWGRLKSNLNNVAKKTQEHIIKDVLNRYFPRMMNMEKSLFEKIKLYNSDEERKKFIDANYAAIRSELNKQTKIIHNSIDNFLRNITEKMNTKIDNSKANDDNKIMLKNYWNLLTTQINMNASIYMIKQREEVINNIFENDRNLASFISKQYNQNETISQQKQEVEKNKAQVKSDEENLKNKETSSNASNDKTSTGESNKEDLK